MGRRVYGLFAAGIAALFGAGALEASCSLETAGITGSTSSTSGIPSGTGGTGGAGGAGGAGTGGGPLSGNPETCPGAELHLALDSPFMTTDSLEGRTHDVNPSCTAADPPAPDIIYRVVPAADGLLKVSLSTSGDFKGSLSIRSSCEDSVVPIELGCTTDPSFQQTWVHANAPYYVIVGGSQIKFSISFTLFQCGDVGTQECDGGDCKGCIDCNQPGEFWDDPMKMRSCYKLVQDKASFAEARKDCLAWGGDLAGINDATELDVVQGSDAIAMAGDVWVGGYGREPACSYVWTDGEPGFPWSGFGSNQATPLGPNDQCIGLSKASAPVHSFDAKPCDTQRSYLCERAPGGTCGDGVIQPGEECDDAPPNCQQCRVICASDEFKDEISHHCYWLGKDATTWDAAKQSCEQQHNGYLAVITSQEENNFLVEHMTELGAGAEVWLGLRLTSFLPPYGQWDRMGERPLCSVHWQTGQPRTDGGLCATLHDDGGWTNRQCTSPHSYVCERGP